MNLEPSKNFKMACRIMLGFICALTILALIIAYPEIAFRIIFTIGIPLVFYGSFWPTRKD